MAERIRMNGMNSGIDTESLVSALVSTKKTNIDKQKKAQTKLEWKQDAWKDMNSKIYGLYAGKASTMRFSTSYSKKVTKTSNSALSVIPGENAVLGVQTAKINSLAKAGYLTGAEIGADENGNQVTSSTKLSDLGIEVGSKFSISMGDKTKEIEITEDMTMGDLTKQMREVGVNVSFDASNKRLFISSPSTGVENDFSITSSDANGNAALAKLGLTEDAGAVRIKATDAELILNGAKFTSSTNAFTINGSTYNVSAVTTDDITVTTERDTSGIYDSIKSLFTEYNDVMKAMSSAYNADAAKGYEPLTDEEREALTEKQADDWEKKVKDGLLSKDKTLSEVMLAMREAMNSGIEVNGKTYYLSDFGINTQKYFEAEENERYSFHIDGDKDDSVSSGKTDKLQSMIASDPDLVTSFFSQLSAKLYDNMYSKMGSTDYSSIYKVYNDKQMKSEYNDYTSKIATLEQKLTALEDKYYKKFSAMETALAKLNSNQSAIAGLLGM